MSTDTESIPPNVPNETDISSAPSQVPESIIGIPLQPISPFFKKNTGYCNIYDKVKSDVIKILHCHGIPGSGKTQVAYNLAKKFLDKHSNDGEKVIAWPIACRESNHDVKKRLQGLADELLRKKFIKKDVNYSIKDDLENNGAVELMRALFKCNAHVLILIEDAKNESKQLLQEMCLQLQNICSQQDRICKFHLYLTSRKKDLLLIDKTQPIGIYQLEPLNGFSKEEAIEFLKDLHDLPFQEVAANEICKRFSCLPFGLLSAREFCRERRIDYERYLIRIKKNEVKLEENQKKFISRKFGQSAQHVFEAIVMPFKPNDSDYETELPWRILSCLSYYYAGCMPKFLLERCCYIINSDPKTKTADPNPNAKKELDVESCTGKLISKLVDEYGLCFETPEKDIVFHQVVLNAFRVHHQALSMDSKCLSMKMAIEVLCSLVTKNFIKEGNYKKMLKLRPHLQSLLNHAGSIDKTAGLRGEELLLFKALLSHLSDVTATIMSGESALQNNHCGEYFEKALGLLWEDKWHDITDITVCDPSLNFEDCSKEIVKLSKSRGQKKAHKHFIIKYTSRLSYCFNERFILESASTEKFNVVETIWQNHSSKRELITQLQNHDIILQDQLYCEIFYAERFASILHSWSRSILDADPEEVRKDDKSAWRSSLSRNISIQCRLSCSVTLLCERLACRAKMSILLEQQKSHYFADVDRLGCEIFLDDLEKSTWKNQKEKILKKLKNVLKIASKEKKAAKKIFENGFPINDSGFSLLTNVRDLVRLYTILDFETSSVDDIQKGDKFCEELQDLAQQNKGKYSNIPSCFVYCAKYYVARKNFPKSLECFDEYFRMSSYNEPKPSFKSYCWAVYNCAKALASHPDPPPHVVEDVKRKGKFILDDTDNMISKDLNDKISVMLRKL